MQDLQAEYLDLYLMHWPLTGNEGKTVEPPIKVCPFCDYKHYSKFHFRHPAACIIPRHYDMQISPTTAYVSARISCAHCCMQ